MRNIKGGVGRSHAKRRSSEGSMCLENGIFAIYIANRGLMPSMSKKHLAHFRGGGGGVEGFSSTQAIQLS